jgi:hypothetical protein
MAILPECPGLKVGVFAQGRQMQEYDDDEDPSPKAITKYIEAQSGTNFNVVARFKRPFSTRYDVMMRVIIDGKSMAKWHCKRAQLANKVVECDGIRRERHGEWVKQNFSFAELEIGKHYWHDFRLEHTDKFCSGRGPWTCSQHH